MARSTATKTETGTKAVLHEVQRRKYLTDKGVDIDQPVQLDLLFDRQINDSVRLLPNDYARSALFTARNRKHPRLSLIDHPIFHLYDSVQIRYTGTELRAYDDELVWMQIMHYASKLPLGTPFEVSIRDLVREIDWAKNGSYYDTVRACLTRLKANEVRIFNQKAYGAGRARSLISNYDFLNDNEGKATEYRITIDPTMVELFAGNTYTSHRWHLYRSLSPTARRLADYGNSQLAPLPLDVLKFRQMCGCQDSQAKSWRETARRACQEVVDAKIVPQAFLEGSSIFIVK